MNKALLSAFVVITFVTYALMEKNTQNTPIIRAPSPTPVSPSPSPSQKGAYQDGDFIGDSVDAFYGNVQVKAIIKNGRIIDVKFLDYPSSRGTSIDINLMATPILSQEAISAQSSDIDIVTGATATSQAFISSLDSALSKAKI